MIEQVRFHMHDYGVSGRLRQIRDGKELAPIYDMVAYKRGITEAFLVVNRELKAGDMLIFECDYENTLSQNIIWGERREDEMCVIALKTKGTDIITMQSEFDSRDEKYHFACTTAGNKYPGFN